jgi:hypothetical protein
MHWFLIVAVLVVGVAGFFTWANRQTKKRHAAFTESDVMAAIQNVLSGEYHDEWDLFLAWPIRDSYLESVRKRCIAISDEYSGKERGKDIATSGEAKLHLILEELKSHAYQSDAANRR